MKHIESIEKSLKEKLSHKEIVRKIYLTYPTSALVDNEEKQYEILNEISQHFKIPISHVQICGSAKVGRSFHKVSSFKTKVSDLDVALIDPDLFLRYTELVFDITNGLQNQTKFTTQKGNSCSSYTQYISKGIFRPDFMPSCPERASWFRFFNNLSLKHNDYFKSINAGIYNSQLFFEHKQSSNIRDFINQIKI